VDREEYLARWSQLHGGFDPHSSGWVVGWLSIVHVVAAPLARRRVPADLVTLAGLLTGAGVVLLAWAGDHWVLAAVPVVVLSGLLDNVDGAVAAMRGTASAWGQVLDSFVDRLTDLLYLAALAVLGAPAWLCAAAAALTLLQESARATGGAAGLRDVGVLTVWERPSRVIVLAFTLAAAGALPTYAGEAGTVGAAVATGLAVIGTTQLLVSLRRRLS
jgi:phosphatidylglycerophosphate synthase